MGWWWVDGGREGGWLGRAPAAALEVDEPEVGLGGDGSVGVVEAAWAGAGRARVRRPSQAIERKRERHSSREGRATPLERHSAGRGKCDPCGASWGREGAARALTGGAVVAHGVGVLILGERERVEGVELQGGRVIVARHVRRVPAVGGSATEGAEGDRSAQQDGCWE